MTPNEIYEFLKQHKWAVEATVTPAAAPQAAVIGFVATLGLELFFDTLKTSRKYLNFRVA